MSDSDTQQAQMQQRNTPFVFRVICLGLPHRLIGGGEAGFHGTWAAPSPVHGIRCRRKRKISPPLRLVPYNPQLEQEASHYPQREERRTCTTCPELPNRQTQVYFWILKTSCKKTSKKHGQQNRRWRRARAPNHV